jgi:hypothetical protein
MNRFEELNFPVMRYTCPQCGAVIWRNDLHFRQFLLDIFEHAYQCRMEAEAAGEEVKRERGN